MERKRFQTRAIEVEAIEYADSFKVFLPDGHVAFEPKDKFLAKYEPKADGPAADSPCESFGGSERDEEVFDSQPDAPAPPAEPEKGEQI